MVANTGVQSKLVNASTDTPACRVNLIEWHATFQKRPLSIHSDPLFVLPLPITDLHSGFFCARLCLSTARRGDIEQRKTTMQWDTDYDTPTVLSSRSGGWPDAAQLAEALMGVPSLSDSLAAAQTTSPARKRKLFGTSGTLSESIVLHVCLLLNPYSPLRLSSTNRPRQSSYKGCRMQQ